MTLHVRQHSFPTRRPSGLKSVNPSLGLESPTSFKPGQLEQRELAFNLDLTYPIAIGTSDPLTLAGGLEYRRETYEITAGDIASWQVGPFASVIDPDTGNRVGLPVGSNGFPDRKSTRLNSSH